MNIRHTILAITGALAITACSHSGQPPVTQSPEATAQGQADAKAILAIDRQPHSLHNALLAVKAREWDMRRDGNTDAADCYINAFREYITAHDEALAEEIF